MIFRAFNIAVSLIKEGLGRSYLGGIGVFILVIGTFIASKGKGNSLTGLGWYLNHFISNILDLSRVPIEVGS